MQNFIKDIIKAVKQSKNVFIFCLIFFAIGAILGAVIPIGETLSCLYEEFLLDYFATVLAKSGFGISFLLKRVIINVLLLLLIALLSLNKYTYYIIFLILFYRAFILGLALKLFLTKLLINGAFFFIFLVLVQAIFLSLAITVYLCLTYKKLSKIDNCSINYVFRCYLISLLISLLGILLEFLFIVLIFRPFNFYF